MSEKSNDFTQFERFKFKLNSLYIDHPQACELKTLKSINSRSKFFAISISETFIFAPGTVTSTVAKSVSKNWSVESEKID